MDLLLAVASFLSPAKASVLLQLVDRMVRRYTRGATSLAAACHAMQPGGRSATWSCLVQVLSG